jgi:hypothetical protein
VRGVGRVSRVFLFIMVALSAIHAARDLSWIDLIELKKDKKNYKQDSVLSASSECRSHRDAHSFVTDAFEEHLIRKFIFF